jgi:hypothetical protein
MAVTITGKAVSGRKGTGKDRKVHGRNTTGQDNDSDETLRAEEIF